MDYLGLRQGQWPEVLIVLGRWGAGSALATFGELVEGNYRKNRPPLQT